MKTALPRPTLRRSSRTKTRTRWAAAYNHAQYIKQRTDLMQWWGDYVENCTQPNVLTLLRRA